MVYNIETDYLCSGSVVVSIQDCHSCDPGSNKPYGLENPGRGVYFFLLGIVINSFHVLFLIIRPFVHKISIIISQLFKTQMIKYII